MPKDKDIIKIHQTTQMFLLNQKYAQGREEENQKFLKMFPPSP